MHFAFATPTDIFIFVFYIIINFCTNKQKLFILLTGSLIYEKLGEKAFGWPGKYTAFVSITMQNIGGKLIW